MATFEWKIRGYSMKHRRVVMYIHEDYHKDNKVTCYNKLQGEYIISMQKKMSYRDFNNKTVLVRKDQWDKKGKLNLEEAYNNFMTITHKILDIDPSIDLRKCGTYKIMALKKFQEMTAKIKHRFKWLTKTENEFVKGSYRGSLIFHKDYEGPAHYYDIRSAYAYIMSHTQFRVPVEQGVEIKLTKKEFTEFANTYFRCGIYTAEVTGYDKRLFRPSVSNHYTHIDLNFAKKEGYTIKLVTDAEINFLSYEGSEKAMSGHQIFRDYVNYFFKYKAEGHSEFKPFLTVLYGGFMESNVKTKVIKADEEFEMNPEQIVSFERDYDNDCIKYTYCPWATQEGGQIFKTPLARLGPFLLSQCRVMMANIMKNQLDKVVRCHTDGWYMTEPLAGPFHESNRTKPMGVPRIGNELGDLEYKLYDNITVKSGKINKN